MTKLLLRVLGGETVSRPPFWFMRQAGRFLPEYRETRRKAKNFLEFCYTPELAIEVALQPLRRYSMDAAILFSDILVIPDALGQEVRFLEGQGPVLEPVRSTSDLGALDVERVVGHLAPVFETIVGVKKNIPETTALIGFAGAPWTVAIYMVEGRGGTDCGRAKRWAYESPGDFAKLIDLLVDATSRYLIEQIGSGAEVIQLFDTWAGVLGESQFRKWVVEPTAEIVRRIKKAAPDVPVIGFPRGAGVLYEDFVGLTGVDGVSLDTTVPVAWAAETLRDRCVVQGNLDNQVLIAGGEALDREARRILKTLSSGPFVFNLGHGILPETPPEHVARLSETILGWPESDG